MLLSSFAEKQRFLAVQLQALIEQPVMSIMQALPILALILLYTINTIDQERYMQVNSALYTAAATYVNKNGNNLPPAKADESNLPQESLSIRDLAQSIDPTNMSRNEARAIADALMKSGDGDLSTVFFLHSAVLIPTGDGTFRNPTESDPIMNEKFNMFDAILSNIEFKESKGLSVERDLSALSFLEKFKIMGEYPKMDIYA